MPRTRARHIGEPTTADETDDLGPMPEVDDSTPEGASRLRSWAMRVERQNRELRHQVGELPRLKLESAALRAGVAVDSPAGKLLIQTYDGPPEPAAVRVAFEELTASVLSHSFAQGQTLSSLAQRVAANGGGPAVELGDDPTEAELAMARSRAALDEVEPR